MVKAICNAYRLNENLHYDMKFPGPKKQMGSCSCQMQCGSKAFNGRRWKSAYEEIPKLCWGIRRR